MAGKKPQFKNSNLKLKANLEHGQKIEASFWFNIEKDAALVDALERYYVLNDATPAVQIQIVTQNGDEKSWDEACRFSLFLPDDRKKEILDSVQPAQAAPPPAPAPQAPPAAPAPAAPSPGGFPGPAAPTGGYGGGYEQSN